MSEHKYDKVFFQNYHDMPIEVCNFNYNRCFVLAYANGSRFILYWKRDINNWLSLDVVCEDENQLQEHVSVQCGNETVSIIAPRAGEQRKILFLRAHTECDLWFW